MFGNVNSNGILTNRTVTQYWQRFTCGYSTSIGFHVSYRDTSGNWRWEAKYCTSYFSISPNNSSCIADGSYLWMYAEVNTQYNIDFRYGVTIKMDPSMSYSQFCSCNFRCDITRIGILGDPNSWIGGGAPRFYTYYNGDHDSANSACFSLVGNQTSYKRFWMYIEGWGTW